jgi:hypothetical protein
MWVRLVSLALARLSALDALALLLVAVGISLRILEYTDNRRLYQDESSLLKNLVSLEVADLTTTLTEFQIAPPGFLIVERFMVRLPLQVVPAARLLPLVCSLASMGLIYAVARRYIAPRAVPLAVGLFALNDWLLYYAAEIKQYSSDVALALVALLLVEGRSSEPGRLLPPRPFLLAVFGVLGVWFSYTLAFILAGVGTYLIAEAVVCKQWNRALRFTLISLTWACSFAICFRISHRILDKGRFIWDWWDFAFLRIPPHSIAELKGDCWQLLNVFNSPAGLISPLGVLPSAFLALGLFAVGAVSLGRRWTGGLYLLLAPILFAIVGSVLQQYPFHNRLLIFLVPSIHLLVAEGAAAWPGRCGALFTFVLGAFLLYQPAFDMLWHRLVVERLHIRADSHGDLSGDLLDYLELQEERRQRQHSPSPP